MPHKDPEVARAYRRKRYHANIEARRKRNRRDSVLFRQRHPEKIKAQNAAYRARNLEKAREDCRAYQQQLRQERPEHVRKINRASVARHKEKRRTENVLWRQAHPQELRAYFQKYRRTHLAQRRAHEQTSKHKRYANTLQAPRNDLTHIQWVAIQEAQDHRCAYCDKRCHWRLTRDHITPLSQGGSNTLHNVIGACGSCNSRKHTGPPLRPVQPLLL